MAKEQQSTYEGLAGIFDALFVSAEEPTKNKKLVNAAPQLLVDDAFPNALMAVGAQVGAFSPALPNMIQEAVFKWVGQAGDLKSSTGLFNIDLPPGKYETPVTRQVDKRDPITGAKIIDPITGKTIKVAEKVDVDLLKQEVKPMKIDLNWGNFVSYLTDPSSFTEKAAQVLIQQISEARKFKAIAGFGDAFQNSAIYIGARMAGVDGDVAALIVDARQNNTLFSPDKEKRDREQPLDTKKNADVRKIAGQDRRDEMYAQILVMVSGELDPKKRSIAAREIENALNSNILGRHNFLNNGNPATDRLTMSAIFNGALANTADPNYALRLGEAQASLAVVFNAISDPTIRANLNAWLANPGLMGPSQFEVFARMAGDGTNRLGKSELGVVDYATGKLAQAHNVAGNGGKANALIGVAATAKGLDGKMSLSEQWLYTRSRWEAIKKDMGAFSWMGFISGDVFRALSTGVGSFGASANNTADFLASWGAVNGLGNIGFFKKGEIDLLMGRDGKPRFSGRLGELAMRDFGITANRFLLSRDANGMQKLFYKLHTFHPWQIIQGFFNGSLFQRMAWMGTNYGRNMNAVNRMTKVAAIFLNSKWYQGLVGTVRWSQYIVRLPFLTVNKIIERGLVAVKKAITWVLRPVIKVVTDFLLKFVSKRVLDIATGGLGLAYDVVNFLTFGLLDKFLGLTIKLILDILLVTLVGGSILLCACASNIGGIGNPAQSNLNADTTFPPDPNFDPQEMSLPDLTSFTNTLPGSINPADYEQFLEGDCPFAQPISCGQGPYGTFTHRCQDVKPPRQPTTQLAIDVSTGDGGSIHAPADGSITLVGDYSCTDGTPTIGGTFEFTADDGTVYGFYHSIPIGPAGTRINKGELIGARNENVPESNCWSGPHVHAFVKKNNQQLNTLEAYSRMCGAFNCTSGETNTCGR